MCRSFQALSWTEKHLYLVINMWSLRSDLERHWFTVADPGFPVGGVDPLEGAVDLRCGCFLAKMYAKMKELGPVGGHVPGTPP